MSNFHPSIPSNKVIKIKPVHYFEKGQSKERDVPEKNELEILQNEMVEARQQLELLKKQQTELLESTKREIENEKKHWQEEKAEWIEQSKEEGYAEGFSNGENASITQYKELLESANSIIDSATEEYHTIIGKSEEAILQLAIYTAEKILKQEISNEPANFIGIIKAAIEELKDKSVITIYLHPVNYQYVSLLKEDLVRMLGDDMKLSLYVHDNLEENACIIEHPFGRIDASVDTQLKQIHNVLQDVLQENQQ